MPDDYKDAIRRAAGLPTEAEQLAAKEEAERKRKVLSDDMPRRDAVLKRFMEKINPKITNALNLANDAFKDEPFALQEIHHGGFLPDLLFQRSFFLAMRQGNLNTSRAQIPFLQFVLMADEIVQIDLSIGSPSFPKLKFKLDGRDLETAVPAAFTGYIKVAITALHPR